MSTARTTPAQKPRGRTRRSTFPLVSVGIFFLSQWFIKTLSYLRGGVSWVEIGGWLTSRSGRLRKAGPTTARRRVWCRGIGSYRCERRVWLRNAERAHDYVYKTRSGL